MTPQEQAAFDAMRMALKHGIKWLNLRNEALECMPLHDALASANAVSVQPQAQNPLTDEQIDQIYRETQDTGMRSRLKPSTMFARAIEAAHGIKE